MTSQLAHFKQLLTANNGLVQGAEIMASPGRPRKDGTPAQAREDGEQEQSFPISLEFDGDDVLVRIPPGNNFEAIQGFLERVRNAFNGA